MMPGSKATPDDNIIYFPHRGGEYSLEEVSLGFDKWGNPKFFDHPELAAIRVDLKFEYDIEAGEFEPSKGSCVIRIFWRCADNNVWEEIPIGVIHHAATDLLEEHERWAKFVAYAEENSVEIPRKTIADYVRESQRRAA